jgi:hypothetical protein
VTVDTCYLYLYLHRGRCDGGRMIVVCASVWRSSRRWLYNIYIYICIEVVVMFGVCRYDSYVEICIEAFVTMVV